MKKLFFILLAISFSQLTHAQVPGYKGKKFLLGYSAQMAPNLNRWADLPKSIDFRLHPKHIFSAEYVAGRHTSAALEAGFANYSYTHVSNYEIPNGEIKMHGGFVGANIRIFGKHLAPIGNYFSVYIHEMFMNFNDTAGASNSGDYPVVEKKPINGTFNTTAFGLSVGTRHMYKNVILVDIGIGLGFSTNTYKSGNIIMSTAAMSLADDFMLYRHVLNYKIGISGLLF